MIFFSFVLSVAIYTIWLNAKLGILISLGGVVLFMLVSYLSLLWQGKSPSTTSQRLRVRLAKQGGLVIVGNVLALGVICGNLGWKDAGYLQMFRGINHSKVNVSHVGMDEERRVTAKWEIFNGFGMIVDTQKHHVYLFEDEEGKTWRLNSKHTYHIGDQIFLSASMKPLDRDVVFDKSFILPWKGEFRDYQFNYDKWIFMKGIDGTAYERQSFLWDPDNPGKMYGQTPLEMQLGFIDRTRAGLQKYVEQAYGENQYAGLLLGLLIGDKALIPTAEYETFVSSGLVHIIAVSGGNIAMVVILLSFLLKWVPLYVRNGLIVLMISFYAMICGGDSSVIRAAIMGSLTLIALFRGREVSIWRAMKYALIGILIFNPFSLVYDVGLVLSFSAIVGIVLFQKMTEYWLAKPQNLAQKEKKFDFFQSKFRKEYLTPTIGASLGTAPVLMFFMNGVNLIGVVLNVIIVPLVPVITIYGFASLFLWAIIQRGGRVWVEVMLMKFVYLLSELGARYAIFVQAKNLFAKYMLVVIFVGIGIWGYWKLMHGTDQEER